MIEANGVYKHYAWTANATNKTATIRSNHLHGYNYTFRWSADGAVVLKCNNYTSEVGEGCNAFEIAKLMTEALKVAFMREIWQYT